MTTLVTGATGFVGAAVVRRLLARGKAVRVLAREGSDRRNVTGLEVETVAGDLRDRSSLEKAVRDCHAVYHVAADYRLWVREPGAIYEVNVEGSTICCAPPPRPGLHAWSTRAASRPWG